MQFIVFRYVTLLCVVLRSVASYCIVPYCILAYFMVNVFCPKLLSGILFVVLVCLFGVFLFVCLFVLFVCLFFVLFFVLFVCLFVCFVLFYKPYIFDFHQSTSSVIASTPDSKTCMYTLRQNSHPHVHTVKTGRQVDRQTDGQTGRQTGGQTDGRTDRQTGRQVDIERTPATQRVSLPVACHFKGGKCHTLKTSTICYNRHPR